MRPSPDLPLETERLLLRPFTRGDVDAVHAYRRREDVARYLFDAPMTRETCAEAIQARIRQVSLAEENDRITLAVERREDGELLGEVTLIWRSVIDRIGEVGYILNPDHQGHGYATEAVRALITMGFADIDLHRIFARCSTQNAPSFRLMERLGMRREAHFREHHLVKGRWDDEYVYALLRDEWPLLNPS
ncbi:MAG TPA: GNAT family protein [Devosiaceae bacterium]|jgi:RimJ/RimL family protein N-acetyltransferase|nr:GNAT family protein [Devosiaceae bacterium]